MDRKYYIIAVSGMVFTLILGVIIGYFGAKPTGSSKQHKEDESLSEKIRDQISADNMEQFLRDLTSEPHIAGRHQDEVELVNFFKNIWEEQGMEVVVHPYKILLSYPNDEDSNYVAMKAENGTIYHKSDPIEKILDPSQNRSGVVNPFNAYSAPGDAEGELVYVNYGRIEDFHYLTRDVKIDLTDKICIARYGKIFRGNKAKFAEDFGCAALIIYSDPLDYTVLGKPVYPDTWYLPPTGAQRGTLMIGNGDPKSPDYPSIETAYRKLDSSLPGIPVTPIGYGLAVKYLEKMGGVDAPLAWQGGLDITYKIGPGFNTEYKNSSMFIHVTTANKDAVAHNVIAFMKGSVEPDRYVLMGSHRDAWVFGSVDPLSGSAPMLEISRVFGEAYKNGWRPRRTMVFCSWGAEEYGLIGSTEWVEEFQKALTARSVTYINLDGCLAGNHTLDVSSFPNLNKLLYEAAKTVPDPYIKDSTIYDVWKSRDPHPTEDIPNTHNLGSGSDYAQFVQIGGISSVDIGYTYDKKGTTLVGYPVYHSVYETFDLMKSQIDREFKYHQALGRVVAEVARKLIDSPLLPFNCTDYAARLIDMKKNFLNRYKDELEDHFINTTQMDEVFGEFKRVAVNFHERIKNIDMNNELEIRRFNDQLIQLDRAFLETRGLPDSPGYSVHNVYAGASFPALADSLFDIHEKPDQEAAWNNVRKQYSILLYHVGSAASTLRETVPISGVSNLKPIKFEE